MKILHFTDPHVSGKNPRHRVDNFPETILKKIEEIYQVAVEEKVDFVAMTGDLFDSNKVYSFKIINKLMEIINSSKIMTYIVIGQHDIYGYNPDTFESSTISIAGRQPYIEVLWKPKDLGKVVLYPCNVWQDFDEFCKETVVDKSKTSIALCHQLISRTPANFEVILTKDIKTDFDLILSGDLHCGYKPHTVNNTIFCNPGAMVRRTTGEVKRKPKYAIINLKTGEIEERLIKCALPGKEVFDDSALDAIKRSAELNVDGFIDGIMEIDAQSLDVFDLVEQVGRQKGVSNDVLEYIKSKKN